MAWQRSSVRARLAPLLALVRELCQPPGGSANRVGIHRAFGSGQPRELLCPATAGSVDDGTLIGRLLDNKSLLSDHLADVSRAGLPDLAAITDGLRAEREQGITIDVAYRFFSSGRGNRRQAAREPDAMTATAAAPSFDLQSHSDRSDGALTPAQVVKAAHAAGVELLALSDHDTVGGVQEALDSAASIGIRILPAVEVSAVDGSREDLHVLGYGIDHHDAELLETLERFRADREMRAQKMALALHELGFEFDDGLLAARARSGRSVGRPHLARAASEDPRNAPRLAEEGLHDMTAFLQAYLLPGKPGYRGRTIPTVQQAIDAIHAAGGQAVWAHPFWDLADPAEVLSTIERFTGLGLDGVEAFYVTHDREQTLLVADACERLDLLSTGSSDFHGPEHRLFSRFRAFSLYGREPRLGPLRPGVGP